MTKRERAALCRRIGTLGGKKTFRKYGKKHMIKLAGLSNKAQALQALEEAEA